MDRNLPTDAELVASTLAGDREAFGQLYDRYARVVRVVVAAVSSDWSSAEDSTQECFLRAFRGLAKLRKPNRVGPWLLGIARQVGHERRRAMRRDRHEYRDSQRWELEESPDADVLEECDQLELVMRRLGTLSEDERLAVHAFHLQEKDAQQTAELLGMSRSGFYALLQRAMARLAAQLRDREPQQHERSSP